MSGSVFSEMAQFVRILCAVLGRIVFDFVAFVRAFKWCVSSTSLKCGLDLGKSGCGYSKQSSGLKKMRLEENLIVVYPGKFHV